ncbi:MAG: SIR2 family protein [Candidatus Dadabacteria bacterium]|nr:SIR2 family protein [Candidatus Dadabacteria bacterium]
MQFVKGGPDIPEQLLQAHEDGQVAFFCGAGISYPAGLPGFADLVKQLYDNLVGTRNEVQQSAIEAKKFDTAIGLLEADIAGDRGKVRRELASILTPDISDPKSAEKATATHEALLTLGRNREGQMRLVTTNFDRLFEEVIATKSLSVNRSQAPQLPIPKNRWDRLVYLHGLLPDTNPPMPNDLDSLVVSSGDFGLAYLTERWAARFVSELFRNYIVCFVGYSIGDPVLRYMMDALAADRLLGESPPEMFAFGSYSKGKEEKVYNEWRAKNVTPILYREHNRHSYLHRTLRDWADKYRDGVGGKESIVVRYAMTRPSKSTKQDDFVGRMLWALSDQTGLPMKRFAEFNPVPHLDWLLEPFSEDRYKHVDLERFGVSSGTEVDNDLKFSLVSRPSPYSLAPWMVISDTGSLGSKWDNIMQHLARWLVRHLDDPALVLWLAKQGGQLHKDLIRVVEQCLHKLAKYEQDGDTTTIDRIRNNAPKAIPGPHMRTLWRLLLAGRVKSRKSQTQSNDFYQWHKRFERDGLTTTLRFELREILTPRVSISEPLFRLPTGDSENQKPECLSELVSWEIVLSAGPIHSKLNDLNDNERERWTAALPELLTDFSALLRDALDLMRELGGADNKSDPSFEYQPSISKHRQNRGFHEWTSLIDLARDAWLATAEQSPQHALLVAEAWWQTPYPLFKRLAFFAATQGGVVTHRRALDWLLADEKWWLWSDKTRRESIRLLAVLAPQIDEPMLRELEQAVLAGPPLNMFRDNMTPEDRDIVDKKIWLRLAEMVQSGAGLSSTGQERLNALSVQHQLAEDERDEFPDRMESGVWGGRKPWLQFEPIPSGDLDGLVNYLTENHHPAEGREDDWQELCKNDFENTAQALHHFARKNIWLDQRWGDALRVWSSDEKVRETLWRSVAPVLTTAPDDFLQNKDVTYGVGWWLKAIAKTFEGHEEEFLILTRRILSLKYQDNAKTDDPVNLAINHPVGYVTQALLDWWYRQTLEDKQGLPEKLKPIFTELCDTQTSQFRHGRVLLAHHVINLFRVDREWTIQHLLPLFNWQQSETEARAVWEGFLWSPRLYYPLMEELKSDFLNTATHYEDLENHGKQYYARILTFAALDQSGSSTFTQTELKRATDALSTDGLCEVAQALVIELESASEQRTNYWTNRVVPYLKSIWPKDKDKITPDISTSLGSLCVSASEKFPDALDLLRHWLQPSEGHSFLVHKLCDSDLCKEFPEESLEFLRLVINDNSEWPPYELKDCLEDIKTNNPALEKDLRYENLMTYLRQHPI